MQIQSKELHGCVVGIKTKEEFKDGRAKGGPKLADGKHLLKMKAEFEDRCRPTHEY